MGFTGSHCEVTTLPACMLGDHGLPIRSWLLHAFHSSAGHERWTRGQHPKRARGLGPVPCSCLQQLVAAPYLIERSRLMYMRTWTFRCVMLPPNASLAAFIEDPSSVPAVWRVFSFEAVHDTLRLGAEPTLSAAAPGGLPNRDTE